MGVPRLQNYINGEWVDATAVKYNRIINPARQELLCEAPVSDRADVDAAVKAAREVYPEWRNTPPVARARYLHRLSAAMEENFEELSIARPWSTARPSTSRAARRGGASRW